MKSYRLVVAVAASLALAPLASAQESVRIGEMIVRDFPNSGIAREVKEKLDTLRQRAAEPQGAGV